MSITPVQGVGSGSTQALQQMAQAATNSNGAETMQSANAIPASAEAQAVSQPNAGDNGFMGSVLDTVYTEIDKLGSKVPAASSTESAVGNFKDQMASSAESINPMEASSIKDPKQEAVNALSKTFDHAIFMAMVNQVVSGVSDTSRTLIKQA